jgi:ADP-ribose pyrophosphatase YjhB (NUDIX family)
MISTLFPAADILYIKDVPCDKQWSENLDEQIKDLTVPEQVVYIYGGRDSFIAHYTGKYETREFKPESYFSGTEIRKETATNIKNTSGWRAGVIHATQAQYTNAVPVIDIAIVREDSIVNIPRQILLGRKRNEIKFRFIGGHVNAGETLEQAAIREGGEESSLRIKCVDYVGSCVIDDWRHRSERTKITSALFIATRFSGEPNPGDDVVELKWLNVDPNLRDQVVDEHGNFIDLLWKHYSDL